MSDSVTPLGEPKAGTSRRTFLKVLGAASATTAAIGCSSNTGEKLIPYLVQPDETVPGVSNYYASTCRECGVGCGVLLEVRDGRTFKVEGNPDHPLNRGALCSRGQASVQGLYNPDRYRQPMLRKDGKLAPISWTQAIQVLEQQLRRRDAVAVEQHGRFGQVIDRRGTILEQSYHARKIRPRAFRTPQERMVIHELSCDRVMAVALGLRAERPNHL